MDRRFFLQRMAAAAAAFTAVAGGRVSAAAGGDSIPAAAGPSRLRRSLDKAKPIARVPPPGVAITADTSKFEKSIGEAGAEVVRLLRECRVTESHWCQSAGSLKRFAATFEHRPGGAPLSRLDTEAWRIIEKGYLTSVSVSTKADADLIDINSMETYRPYELRHVITVEFVVEG